MINRSTRALIGGGIEFATALITFDFLSRHVEKSLALGHAHSVCPTCAIYYTIFGTCMICGAITGMYLSRNSENILGKTGTKIGDIFFKIMLLLGIGLFFLSVYLLVRLLKVSG